MSSTETSQTAWGMFVSLYYATLFISLMYLFMRWVVTRTRWNLGPLASVLLGLAMVALLTILSSVLYYNLAPKNRYGDFSVVSAGNWYWATWEASESGGTWTAADMLPLLCLGFFAFLPISWAFLLASRELLTRPLSLPQRITLDNQEIVESKKPPAGETIDDIFNEPRPGDTT